MAIQFLQDVQPAHRLRDTFDSLLERAREIKPSTGVEPEIPAADIIEDVKSIEKDIGGGTLQHALVESVAQDIIYETVVRT
jgi:hypothetical protein